MKNFSDTIGNRNRDVPAYSAMPLPTVLPRAPNNNNNNNNNNKRLSFILEFHFRNSFVLHLGIIHASSCSSSRGQHIRQKKKKLAL